MKSRISLFVLLVFVCKNTWGEEFEIIVSRELIQAIAMENHGAESLSSLKRKNIIDSSAVKSPEDNVGLTRSEPRVNLMPSSKLADIEYVYDPVSLLPTNELGSSTGAGRAAKSKPGYYSRERLDQNSNNHPLFSELQQEVRSVIGEEGYEKALWNYNNLKLLDDYINSSMNQFVYQSLGSSYGFFLTDWMVFEGNSTGGTLDSSSARVASGRTDLASADTYRLTTADSDPSIVQSNSLLFVLFKHLTIRNSLYLLLTVFCSAYLVRGVRFLLTGRRIARMRG